MNDTVVVQSFYEVMAHKDYDWQEANSSGQTVNPDYAAGNAITEVPSMKLPPETYIICLYLDYSKFQSELRSIMLLLPAERCHQARFNRLM